MVDHNPRAFGQPDPVALRITQMLRHKPLDKRRSYRLQQPLLQSLANPSDVGCDKHIGRRSVRFQCHPVDQLIAVGFDQIDPNPRGFRKTAKQLFVRAIMPSGIHIHHGLGRTTSRKDQQEQ